MNKEVTKEQFFNEIRERKLDVVVRVIGEYPYTNEFRFRGGTLFGKIVRTPNKDKGYPFYTTQYFIC